MRVYSENYKYFLIIDLEATCCDKGKIARREMEIIEIGAVLVESQGLTVVDEFVTFIKPMRHPILTSFCTELTTITQEDVNSALSYPDAIKIFQEWLCQYNNYIFCSWGDYDKRQLEQDSKFHGISDTIGSKHINIKKLFSISQRFKKRYGMVEALKVSGLKPEGIHHRGIDDAKNMTRLMPFILGRKSVSMEG